MPAPLIPVGIGAAKLGAKAGLTRFAGGALMNLLKGAGVTVGLGGLAGIGNAIKNLPKNAIKDAVRQGPDEFGEYSVPLYLAPIVNEQDKKYMGGLRKKYLERKDPEFAGIKELTGEELRLTADGVEELEAFKARTRGAVKQAQEDADFKNMVRMGEYVSPVVQAQLDNLAATARNQSKQIDNQNTQFGQKQTLLQSQLAEQKEARQASDQRAAQAQLDAVNAGIAQLEYQKGRDAADMRRFELLLDRQDEREARRRQQALIQGLTQFAGSMFN